MEHRALRFEPITDANVHYVDAIYPGDQERFWVYYNWYWRDWSRARDDIDARLIYVDGIAQPVGFIAYGQHYRDEDLTDAVPGWYEIIHLVIDRPFQRRGYGRAATRLAIDLLRERPDCAIIAIAHNPYNRGARRLYESLGFTEAGRNYDGDPLLILPQESDSGRRA
jgi:diamine N-acetyltransferase